jgi:hypothetical protein
VKLNTKQAIAMARMNPRAVLNGDKPRLIDEWQKAPDIWNQVKDDLDFVIPIREIHSYRQQYACRQD